jgi:hypothetical protein
MRFSLQSFPLAVALVVSQSLSAPKIQFDQTSYDVGTIIEAQTRVIKTVFNVKNTGDATLKLEKVRPSCPCVSVKYDSLIEPGKTGRIESLIDTKGFHSGPTSKFIMVASNAKNSSPIKLTIAGRFQATIDVSSRYLSFNTATGQIRDTIYLATKKNDLTILGVEFQSADPSSDKSDWHAEIPLAIGVNPLPKDSTRTTDGYKVFEYEFIAPSVKQSQEGWLIIKTNHPDKPEVIIQGNILK